MFQSAKLILWGVILSTTVWQCQAADRPALPQRADGGAFASRALGRARGASAFTDMTAATPTTPMSTHQRQALTKRWVAKYKQDEMLGLQRSATDLAAAGLPPMRVGPVVYDADIVELEDNCCRKAMVAVPWAVMGIIWGASLYYSYGPCCRR